MTTLKKLQDKSDLAGIQMEKAVSAAEDAICVLDGEVFDAIKCSNFYDPYFDFDDAAAKFKEAARIARVAMNTFSLAADKCHKAGLAASAFDVVIADDALAAAHADLAANVDVNEQIIVVEKEHSGRIFVYVRESKKQLIGTWAEAYSSHPDSPDYSASFEVWDDFVGHDLSSLDLMTRKEAQEEIDTGSIVGIKIKAAIEKE